MWAAQYQNPTNSFIVLGYTRSAWSFMMHIVYNDLNTLLTMHDFKYITHTFILRYRICLWIIRPIYIESHTSLISQVYICFKSNDLIQTSVHFLNWPCQFFQTLYNNAIKIHFCKNSEMWCMFFLKLDSILVHSCHISHVQQWTIGDFKLDTRAPNNSFLRSLSTFPSYTLILNVLARDIIKSVKPIKQILIVYVRIQWPIFYIYIWCLFL